MKKLISSIKELKNSEIKSLIDKRLKEFSDLGKKSSSELFKELCFCILTANSTADRCIAVQKKIKNSVITLKEKDLAKTLKKHSCRFHTKRASYISEARTCIKKLNRIVKKDSLSAREWLNDNIKGLGMKESSHFLRNIGFTDLAIIDFHIIDILAKNKIINKPKTLNKNNYLEIEQKLKQIAEKANLNLAELDLYLWYMETGKVLK
jgi:N-glycosylase/DNA lyase